MDRARGRAGRTGTALTEMLQRQTDRWNLSVLVKKIIDLRPFYSAFLFEVQKWALSPVLFVTSFFNFLVRV